jgi:osmotically inducible protein OsmC
MKRTASAIWHGGLKDGKGMVSTESGGLKQTPYSFSTRFEGQPGTNPEELIAAAHAGCFSMALSAELGKAGLTPETIRTSAALTMEKLDSGWTVTQSHLDVTVKIPGADKGKFEVAASAAKAGCPISRLLNAKITMDAKLGSFPVGQNNLGYIYANGKGVPKDFVEAYKWFSVAARGGNEKAAEILKALERQMSKEQVANAKQSSAELAKQIDLTKDRLVKETARRTLK